MVSKKEMSSLPVSNKHSGKPVIFVINLVFLLQGKTFISNTDSVSIQNYNFIIITAQKMKFSSKDFFSKCDQILSNCRFGHIY